MESLDYFSLDQDMMDQDYVGIKVGDVNGTVTLNLSNGAQVESRSDKTLYFELEDRSFVKGEEFSVKISSDNFSEVNGYQFALSIPGLELIGVDAMALNVDMANFGIHDNLITTSWHSEKAVNISSDDSLFELRFKATSSGSISDISISEKITKPESYLDQDKIAKVALKSTDSGFVVHQNTPNPFSNSTIIAFEIPSIAMVELSVFDVTGKLLYVIESEYNAGYNEVELSADDIDIDGVLYYQIKSGDFAATKKMILMN